MNIIQCQFCRKPFASVGGRICPDCLQQLDHDFITVRDYIDEHKRANIKEISEETEVPEKHIIHLIKEGRLIMDTPGSDDGTGLITCEMCHKPISTGRLCEGCKKKLTSTIDNKSSHSDHKDGDDLKSLGKIR